MGLKIKLGKAEHDALDDSLKTLYVADGENFKLDADYEDVTGLKSKRDELLAEQKRLKQQLQETETKYAGLDPEAAKAALAEIETAKETKLKESGDFDAIKKGYEDRIAALETKHKSELEAVTGENTATLTTLKRERLANVLTEKGVLPDRVKYLVHEMDADTELVRGDNGFDVRKKGGIGDATEFEALIENVKVKSPFFFAADNASGSGASGSDGKGGSQTVKRLTKAQVAGLSPQEKHDFYIGGGEVTDRT